MVANHQKSSEPIKVLLVAPSLPIVGGQTVQGRLLVDKFTGDRTVQIDLQPINPRFLSPFQQVKYLRTVVTTFKYLTDLFLKIPKFDVVHIFSASYWSFILAPTPAMLISRLFGKKTILNYRSGEADDHLVHWKTAVPTIRGFDRVIVPSGYLVEIFNRHGLEAQSIFNVVDTNRFQFRKRNPLRPVFLSNRNLEPLYNVGCVVRAFARIQESVPDARLLIAGDGSQKGNLLNLVTELGLKNIEFLGSITPSEMPSIYDRADIYLNSPNLDNMPNSIIESFASGLPVVSTNAGGIPYIVEHERNGLLVKLDDHVGLSREALRLLDDRLLAERLVAQAQSDCEKYSWDSVRSQWIQLYEELVNGHSSFPTPESEGPSPVSVNN